MRLDSGVEEISGEGTGPDPMEFPSDTALVPNRGKYYVNPQDRSCGVHF